MSDGILFIGKTNKIIVDQLELSKEQVDGEWFGSFSFRLGPNWKYLLRLSRLYINQICKFSQSNFTNMIIIT